MHNCLYSCQSCPSSQSTICNHTEDITVQCSRLYTYGHCILSSLVSLSFTFSLVYDSGSQESGTGGIASACDCKIYIYIKYIVIWDSFVAYIRKNKITILSTKMDGVVLVDIDIKYIFTINIAIIVACVWFF